MRAVRAPAGWQRWARMGLIWLGLAGLLYLALRNVPLVEIVRLIGGMETWQALVLVAANLLILLIMTSRWALLLRAMGHPLRVLHLLMLRLAGFGISYFTPGPQFGGEPVQIDLLRRRGVPLPAALSSVLLDRLVDLLANFTFLMIGLLTVLSGGVLVEIRSPWVGLLAMGIFLMPMIHLIALWLGRQPLTWLLGLVMPSPRWVWLVRVQRLIEQSEVQITALCRAHPGTLVQMILLSVLAWGLVLVEFALMLYFLGAQPSLPQIVSALTAARLAFLSPLPGAVGVLEAGQVWMSQAFGWGAPLGLALSLLIRARDLLLASLGLWLSGWLYQKEWMKGVIVDAN